jgi:hypothetical protein
MRTIFITDCRRRAYRTPAVRTKGLRTEASFLTSGSITNNFGLNDMSSENDVSGHWED